MITEPPAPAGSAPGLAGSAAAGSTLFGRPALEASRGPGGTWRLGSAEPLGPYPPTVLASLRRWAAADPSYPLIAERDAPGGWRARSYGDLAAAAEAVGQGLLDLGLGPGAPLLILSGNSVDHLTVLLAAMTAGIPVAPVSTAYSLLSADHARIGQIAALIRPGGVFAEDADQFAPALDALDALGDLRPRIVVASRGRRGGYRRLADLAGTAPGPEVAAAYAGLGPDSLAKVLFTSGSTGEPKGVLNTHGMLSANQVMMQHAWPFLTTERPVIVDWLPWSHTFGGNHDINMMITAGGTLYIDAGRPAPALFGQSVANLAEVAPTIYLNVPAGYAQLVPVLESDPEFAARFFSRLRLMLNAAAALPPSLRQRLTAVAERVSGRPIPVTSAWGLTETSPACTSAYYDFADPACIGIPLPGAELKLVPADDAYEILVRGPHVTPGYFGRPDLTSAAFDAEGFYRTGDAARLIDEAKPGLGLAFCGRIAEDFKLTTGTFVRVGAVRTALLSAVPLLSDAVIAGEGRDFVTALAWLNAAEAAALPGREPGTAPAAGPGPAGGEVITDTAVLDALSAALAARPAAGSAARVERLLVLSRPADLDHGEITDKGYVNQRRVLRNRAALVDLLYASSGASGVISARPAAPAQ
ncbi:MAG TPA: AMP-binding protein [Streptosporangiaceae bacterium]|jgi:feruloyl-CoA synthase